MKTIWDTLKKPIFALAPMEDVTDTVFRQILGQIGKPAISFTEFTNVDGMFSSGARQVTQRLAFSMQEKPLIAQIWGLQPEHYKRGAQELVQRGFDGIDINMGCPQDAVVAKGCCAALMHNKSLAAEIIQATKEGAGKLPVSVKTRIGYGNIETEEWVGFLLDQNIALLTLHLRTVQEMSKVPPHWDEMQKAVRIRKEKGVSTLLLGNGDIASIQEAKEKVDKYNIDGIMIGRGILHNPWLFDQKVNSASKSLSERVTLLLTHARLFEKT